MTSDAQTQHFDTLIIGAGISGIDVAYHLNRYCGWASYAILERRSNLGGTWDLFRYPGIRSDSDMFTFGFSWKIWKSAIPIATGDEILAYLNEAVREEKILEKIKFNTDISTAEWNSADNRWHLTTSDGRRYSCWMLIGCTGYFSYENPHRPTFPGEEKFPGPILHPQEWNADADTAIMGKKVAIIGSGATAVTMLPSIVNKTNHVTMVQRSPTYIFSKPVVDPVAKFLTNWLPESVAPSVNRWKNVVLGQLFFQFCMNFRDTAKKFVRRNMWDNVKECMTLEEFDKNFTPPYNPWEQRLCLSPGADFFEALRGGGASVATGVIETFTESGIQLTLGQHVDAEVIVSATGLTLQNNFPFSTIRVTVDGEKYKPTETMLYKGVMCSGVPNYGFVMGYTNASWTLKADIAAMYFTKLLNHMRENGVASVTPRVPEGVGEAQLTLGLTSGYVSRSGSTRPKQGDKDPWIYRMNYFRDLWLLWWYGVEDRESLQFDDGVNIDNASEEKRKLL